MIVIRISGGKKLNYNSMPLTIFAFNDNVKVFKLGVLKKLNYNPDDRTLTN